MKKGEDPLAKLSPEKREIRKEVQDAKRHREFMNRVAKNNEKELDDAIATSEIVTIATGETVQTVEQTTELPEVDFESMTKKQIDEWAEENLGIQ